MAVAGAGTMEALTRYEHASIHNNFYEFGTDKADPVAKANTLRTRPWTVSVEGLVGKPRTFDIENLLKNSAPWKSACTGCAALKAGRW